jgi:hypothetical protein
MNKSSVFTPSTTPVVTIDDTGDVIIPTFLAVVVAIFVISTPLLPFKSTYAYL